MGRTKTTALANYDEELAKQAKVVADAEAAAVSGAFFSFRGGQLQFNGAPLAGNQVAVVVADYINENVYYDEDFDPDSPATPACYAFGRPEDGERSMQPHDDARDKQADSCVTCENNEWGSSGRGRGKACANRRRLAVIPAGLLDAGGEFTPMGDPEDFEKSPLAFMKLPVTSVKAYAQYVNLVAKLSKRPPHGVFTKVSVRPDSKRQFVVEFENLGNVPKHLLGVVMKRHEEAREAVAFPYVEQEETKPKRKTRSKTRASDKKKKTTKKKTARGRGSKRF